MTAHSWVRTLFARKPLTIRKAPARRRPSLEALEDRALPAVTFLAPAHYAAGAAPETVAVGDFNGDGKQDLAVGTAGGVSVLLGNGDGTFQDAVNTDLDDVPTSMAVGDFNGDGKPDLAVTYGGLNSVRVLLGDGTFQDAVSYAAGASLTSMAVGGLQRRRQARPGRG
jgi:hypothetical protein